jgi:hypothetical protein
MYMTGLWCFYRTANTRLLYNLLLVHNGVLTRWHLNVYGDAWLLYAGVQ